MRSKTLVIELVPLIFFKIFVASSGLYSFNTHFYVCSLIQPAITITHIHVNNALLTFNEDSHIPPTGLRSARPFALEISLLIPVYGACRHSSAS